jgi:hypothetical protein
MKPTKQPTPMNVPNIDWLTLTDQALGENIATVVAATTEAGPARLYVTA